MPQRIVVGVDAGVPITLTPGCDLAARVLLSHADGADLLVVGARGALSSAAASQEVPVHMPLPRPRPS